MFLERYVEKQLLTTPWRIIGIFALFLTTHLTIVEMICRAQGQRSIAAQTCPVIYQLTWLVRKCSLMFVTDLSWVARCGNSTTRTWFLNVSVQIRALLVTRRW